MSRDEHRLSGKAASIYMRGQLAAQGIFLDDNGPLSPYAERLEIRKILAAAGAPADKLDQLTASCSSIEAAHAYRPAAKPDLEEP